MGGAGGHMWHPFDCPDVNSGQELINFFRKSIEWAKTNKPALKIDGVNLSFRVIENPSMPTGYEFAVDRGSQEELDRFGVTAKNAHLRFVSKDPSKPHGMIDATDILTAIFNDALPDIMPELEQLGMLENIGPYSKYFNTEFVLKQINVKEYAFDFIAIHSVNDFEPNRYPDDHKLAGQIRWKKNKDIQVDGVGDTNPDSHEEGDSVPGHVGYLWRWDPLAGWAASIPGSKVGKETDYDQAVLDRLKDKVKPHALKKEFRVYTSITTDTVRDVALEKALNESFTIVYSSQMRDPEEPGELGIGEGSTKSIKSWLADVSENPLKKPILISDAMIQKYPKMNKKQLAMAKNIYIEVLKGTAVNEIVDSPEFIEPVVDGVVIWHATRQLGNAVLDSLESEEFGAANDQEGVVIKDKNICGGTRFKFTGDFIVGGLASTFEEQKFRQGRLLESFMVEADPVGQQRTQYVILIPGGFKPPTGGHYSMIKQYEKRSDVAKVIVVTGFKPRKDKYLTVTYQQSKAIFDLYGGFGSKVEFREQGQWPTPMRTCYELMNDRKFVSQYPGVAFALGASDKDDDEVRIGQFAEYFKNNPSKAGAQIVDAGAAKAYEVRGEPASASRMRNAYVSEDWELFKELLPDDNFYDDVVQILMRQDLGPEQKQGGPLNENFLSMNSLFSLVDEVLLEEQNYLNENEYSFVITEQESIDLEEMVKSLAIALASRIPGTLNLDQRTDVAATIANSVSSTIEGAITRLSSEKEQEKSTEGTEEEIRKGLEGAALEEMSMAGGAVQGAPSKTPNIRREDDDRSRTSITGI